MAAVLGPTIIFCGAWFLILYFRGKRQDQFIAFRRANPRSQDAYKRFSELTRAERRRLLKQAGHDKTVAEFLKKDNRIMDARDFLNKYNIKNNFTDATKKEESPDKKKKGNS